MNLLLWNIIAGKAVAGQPGSRPARGPSPQARRLWRFWNVLHDACGQAMHQERSRNASTNDSGEHSITWKCPRGKAFFKRCYFKILFPRACWELSQSRPICDALSRMIQMVRSCKRNMWSKCQNFSRDVSSWWGTENNHAWIFIIKLLEVMDEKLLKIWVWRELGATDFGSSARQWNNIWSRHGREENHTWHSSRLRATHTWLRSWKDAWLRKASELAHFSLRHTEWHYD